MDCHSISDNLHKSKFKIQKKLEIYMATTSCALEMVSFILATWIKLGQMQRPQLSHGQMEVRNILHKELII